MRKGTAGQAMAMAVVNDTGAGEPVEILIYDVIDSWGGEWGVSAMEVVTELAALRGRPLSIRVNSPGGMATEGAAIYNALLSHGAPVTVTIDGVAASAASFIAMAGDTVSMYETSTMMIHGASMMAWGSIEDLREAIASLEVINASMAAAYAAKTGKPVEEIVAMMGTDTWYTAQQAKDAGLIDVVIPAGRTSPVAPPAAVASAMARRRSFLPAAALGGLVSTQPESTTATDLALVVDPAADEAETALEHRVEAEGGDPADLDTSLVPGVPAPTDTSVDATPAASAIPETVTLSKDVYEGLLAGQAAAAEHRLDGLVDAAVASGRITPAGRPHWRALLVADPGAEAMLAALAPGVVPIVERGTATDAPLAASGPESAVRAIWPVAPAEESIVRALWPVPEAR